MFTFEDDVQVYVDPKSMVFLNGMTLDWKDSLLQSGFRVRKPSCEEELRLRNIVHRVMSAKSLSQDYFSFLGFPESCRWIPRTCKAGSIR